MLFNITAAFHRITDITPEVLRKMGIRGLILDIDNTLTTHDDPAPAEGVTEWLELMRAEGIHMMIVSNNHPPRVQPFAESLGLDFLCEGQKPLPKGYREAAERMGLPMCETAAVGDQIFTDVLGANLSGVKMLYVEPIAPEPDYERFILFKRKLEKPFLPKKIYRRDPRKEKQK